MGGICEDSLKQIFGSDLMRGADELEDFSSGCSEYSSNPASYKINRQEWRLLIRGFASRQTQRNFLHLGDRLIEASQNDACCRKPKLHKYTGLCVHTLNVLTVA